MTVKALLVPGPEKLLKMIGVDVGMPGVIMKKLEADVGEVVFGGLLVFDPVEPK